MMYLTISFGWVIAVGLALAACRVAAVGDGDRYAALGPRKPFRWPRSDKKE
jgi:hypothetical protein